MAQRATSLWYFVKGTNSTTGSPGAAQSIALSPAMGLLGPSTTESAMQVPFRTAGTLSGLMIRVPTNGFSNAVTFKSRIGGVDGNQLVTVGAGLTGDFQDTTHSDAIAGTGDLVSVLLSIPAQSNSFTFVAGSFKFLATATTDTVVRHQAAGAATTAAPGVTNYKSISGLGSTQTTEAREQFKVKVAGTYRNMFVNIATNTLSTASTTFRFRKNTANGNMNVVVGAGLTGIFEDTSNTDSVAVDDLVNTSSTVAAGGSGTITYGNVGVSFVTTTSQYHLICATNDGLSVSSSLTTYVAIGGALTLNSTTESNVQALAGIAATYSHLEVDVITNTTGGSTTVRTRKNNANGGQSVAIGAGLTGVFEDTSNTDSVVATDSVNYQIVTPAPGGNAIRINDLGLLVAPTTVIISASDTGTGTDTGGKVGIARSDSGAGAETSVVHQSVATSDAASGAEVSAVRVTLVRSDSGAGTDTAMRTISAALSDAGFGAETSRISQARTETGAGSETSTPSASIARSETATGIDTANVTVSALSFPDPSNLSPIRRTIRSFVPNVGAGLTVLFARAGWPYRPIATAGATHVTTSDTATGTEGASRISQVRAETAAGVDASSPVSHIVTSDSGVGAEGTRKVIQARVDAAAGTETSSVLIAGGTLLIHRSDSATGTETISAHAQITRSDQATGAESSAPAVRAVRSDQASGAESAATSAAAHGSDTANGAETTSQERASIPATDVASGVDSSMVRQERTDTATDVETSQLAISSARADSATAAETSRLEVQRAEAVAAVEAAILIIRSADSGAGADASQPLAVSFQRADAGLGADVVSYRQLEATELALGVEHRARLQLLKYPLITVPTSSSLTFTTPVKGSITHTEAVVP